jgi:glycogen synthase
MFYKLLSLIGRLLLFPYRYIRWLLEDENLDEYPPPSSPSPLSLPPPTSPASPHLSAPTIPKTGLRVLHLTTEFPPVIYGGLGTAIGGLVHASIQAGLTVGVLLVGEAGHGSYGQPLNAAQAAQDAAVIPNVNGISLFQAGWFDAIDRALSIVEQWRPDVIHLHPFWLWPIASAIQERAGIPVVYTVHSLDRAEYEIGQGPPECLTQWGTQEEIIAQANRVIALTESERILLSQYCPAANDRVRIVGNGIDDTAVARQTVARKNYTTSAPVILYTGRFVDRKGVRELIAAIPQVLQKAPQARFILAGGHRHCSSAEMEHWWLPPDLAPYRERILFTGWLTPSEVAEWYQSADILVVPSWYEPFGMVILEGMLYGLPIAAAQVGGPAEILHHEKTGLLFPPKDANAIAQALLRLIHNPGLRRQLGNAAAQSVRQNWLWSKIVAKIQVVYQETISYNICAE